MNANAFTHLIGLVSDVKREQRAVGGHTVARADSQRMQFLKRIVFFIPVGAVFRNSNNKIINKLHARIVVYLFIAHADFLSIT